MHAKLDEALEASLRALSSGSRMHDGWIEFYYYLPSPKQFDIIAASVMKAYETYAFETATSRDTHWEHHRKTLYPDDLMIQQISSRKIIEELVEAGDELTKQRPVEHYLVFQTEAQRDRVVESLRSSGFSLNEHFDHEGSFAYGAILSKEHEVTLEPVMDECRLLLEAVQKEHGSYEGWSTILAE